MSIIETGLLIAGLLFVFLGSGVWIFTAMLAVAALGLHIALGFPVSRLGAIVSSVMLNSATKWELSAIPLFLFMGDLILRSDISDRIFRGLRPIMGWIPGGLLHSNVLGCTFFAAVSGSSSATTATVGKITLPALQEMGFNRSIALGSLAASGGLGLLIPPSIMLIIYGVLAEQSIIKLFAAGIVPGIMLSALYSSYIMVRYRMTPSIAPDMRLHANLREQFAQVWNLAPIAFLMLIVLGGIYSGLATPSEAAALGVAAALLTIGVLGQLSVAMIWESAMSAVVGSAMICSIMVSSSVLSSAMAYLHLPQEVAATISELNAAPLLLITLLALFYIVLGLFLDGISIAVMTLPITFPIVVHAGYDPIWYGIFLVIMVEAGLITPPLGLNLFVVQGLTGEKMGNVARAALPFFLLMLVGVAMLVAFPQIALWLPDVLEGSN